jgi:hypothetical protein
MRRRTTLGVVALAAALAMALASAGSADASVGYCTFRVNGLVLNFCSDSSTFTALPMSGGSALPESERAANAFRGWARVHGVNCDGRLPNPCAVGNSTPTSIAAYRWANGRWVAARLAQDSWVQAQHYTGNWAWAYQGGQWYAVDGVKLEAYCAPAPNSYSNCIRA